MNSISKQSNNLIDEIDCYPDKQNPHSPPKSQQFLEAPIQNENTKISDSFNETQQNSNEQFNQDQLIVDDIIMNLQTEQDNIIEKLLIDPPSTLDVNQQGIKLKVYDRKQEIQISSHHNVLKQQTPLSVLESEIQHQKQIAQKQNPYCCPYPHPLFDIPMPDGFKAFLQQPSPKGGMIQCTVQADHSLIGLLYPKYHLYLSNGHIYMMTAQVKSFHGNSYHFYTDKNKQEEIALVKKNENSSEYIFSNQYQSDSIDESKVLGAVTFDNNDIQATGPISMKVLLDIGNQEVIQRVLTCVSRKPEWNTKYNAFVVEYYGRVNKPSERNFQLVEETHDNILLQFGVYDHDYNLDFQWPICPLQAFQIAIASINYKRK